MADMPTVLEFRTIPYNLAEYRNYVADFDPLSDTPVKSEGLWRHTAEHVIFTLAPILGGCHCEIRLLPFEGETTFVRAMVEVASGRALSHPAAGFPAMIEGRFEDVALSEPVLQSDAFFVGLYTHETRHDVLALTDMAQIRALRFAVASSWALDIQILQDRGLTIVEGSDWPSVLRMVQAGRADVVMQPFSQRPDMSFVDNATGLTFRPIPDIKMAFPHGRRYVVSTKHPLGPAFLEHLNRGLRIMQESGLLREYMVKSGVLDPRITDFHPL